MPSNTTNYSFQKPTVGADGDLWGDYLDSNWNSLDGTLFSIQNSNISNSAPTIKSSGTIWLNNTTNPWILNIYDGSNWVSIGTVNPTNHSFTASSTGLFIGDLKISAQAANHGSWILCNGQGLSTTTYSGLFNVIGYNFGGSGATFNAPDLRGQVAGGIGQGSYSGASTRTLGQFVGEEAHTLTIPEMPSHNHAANGGNFLNDIAAGGNIGINPGGNGVDRATTANTGGDTAHNTMQPTLFAGNYFIYSGI